MALYQKLPRSRLKSNMDGEDTIVKYRDASPKARAGAAPYKKPAPKNTTVIYKTPGPAPKASASAPDSSLAKPGRSSAPVTPKSSTGGPARYSKGSTQPPAYKGEAGDKKVSKGAVTSYQKDGYTFTMNSKGVFQNFSGAKTPSTPKKDKR